VPKLFWEFFAGVETPGSLPHGRRPVRGASVKNPIFDRGKCTPSSRLSFSAGAKAPFLGVLFGTAEAVP